MFPESNDTSGLMRIASVFCADTLLERLKA
jgi:hypothetical protein